MITYQLANLTDLIPVNNILHAIDPSFPIPLSVKTNLDELAAKFLNNGYVYMALDGEYPVGLLGFYANNYETRAAYISVLGVLESHQGRGIAKRMVIDSLTICKERGMTSCFLYTHKTNTGAIAMYQRLDFVAEEDPTRPYDIKFVKEL